MVHAMLFAAVPGWMQPLWMIPAGVIAALAVMAAVYGVLLVTLPKVAAIARTTAHEGLAQLLFLVELVVGVLLSLMFAVMPYGTFGDDVKMMKETSLELLVVLASLFGVWTASVSIAEELEGKTALTLLSKPVNRWQFVLGKFIGVLTPVALLFIALGAMLLFTVSFKVVYEAIIPLSAADAAKQCADEMLLLLPALLLSFFKTIVLTSIAVALSTRLTMMSNLLVCFAIYVLGHLVPLLVQSPKSQNSIVSFVGQLLATVLPVLDHFNVNAAIAMGNTVPVDYIAWAAGYALLYSTIAMLLALLLFEERDLG